MSNKQEKKTAPLAAIYGEPQEEFNFYPSDLSVTRFNLSVLSDFKKTNLLTLRKVFKNISLLNAAQKERVDELSQLSLSIDKDDETMVSQLTNLSESKIPVRLFTLSMEDFPSDRSEFGTRDYVFGKDKSAVVDYVVSFLELVEALVIKE